jgi:hypothetical protein
MKPLVTFIFIFYSLQAISLEVAGTPPRIEQEFKFAYKISDSIPIKKVIKTIEKSLKTELHKVPFHFSKMLNKNYSFSPLTKTFIFKDYYLDTEDFKLYQNHSDYRLRYRWASFNSYLGFTYLPFLNFFYPNRCEIQYKFGYKSIKHVNLVTANEARFEFRNQSKPFLTKQNAPAAPWPYAQYIQYAKTGNYKKDYRIIPFHILNKHFSNKYRRNIVLNKIIPITTIRYRNHLLLDTPWGSGPNPTQAFIISLDLVTYVKKNGQKFNFIELELEMERNVSTLIDLFINPPKELAKRIFKDNELVDATKVSKQARENFENDQFLLAKLLTSKLQSKLKLRPLPVRSKYGRVVEFIRNSRDK